MPEVVNVDVAVVVVICCIADDALDAHVSFKTLVAFLSVNLPLKH